MFKMYEISQFAGFLYLTALSYADIRYKKLPVWGLCAGFAMALLFQIAAGETPLFLIIAGGAVGVFFLGLSKITRENFGYGDSVLILILGVFLGLWNVLSVICIAFFLSAVYAVLLLALCRCGKKRAFPFVPFLALGYLGGMIFEVF